MATSGEYRAAHSAIPRRVRVDAAASPAAPARAASPNARAFDEYLMITLFRLL